MMRIERLALACVVVLAGCAAPLAQGVGGAAIRAAGPGHSMFSLFETEAGLVVVDLGWWGAASELRNTLAAMDADSTDVVAVFLTHAHRDHIAAWPVVRGATFYLAEAEAPHFFGEAEYEGWIPRTADRLAEPLLPRRGDIEVITFASDTAIVMGRDTVHAFLVPGHTPGSTAYLMRGVLFAGDALARTPWGFRHALPGYSDDVAQAAASLRSLFERVEPYDVRMACTAHAECAEFNEAFRREALAEQDPIRSQAPVPRAHPIPGQGT
jgi:glyoxylase-like metal-dependent hydrolase (beta-lactamase superfamily II)